MVSNSTRTLGGVTARATLLAVGLFVSGQAATARAQLVDQAMDRAQQTAPAATPAVPARQLSIDDAVQLALEQNVNIQVERLAPRIQDLSVAQAQTAWTPNAFSAFQSNNTTTPPNSFLSGAQQALTSDTLASSVGFNQLIPWGGGNYSISWDSSRNTTNNIFTNFDPTLRSVMRINVVQPLLQNFAIDGARQQLLVTRKNRELSDIQLRQTVVSTVRSVKNAYWDLVIAHSNLEVSRQSLELAQQTLRDNRTRVEIGTMAPIDIVEAESEVARNEEAVIVAEAAIGQAEDQFRALVLDPATPDFWNVSFELSDAPNAQAVPIDVDAAIRNALDRRTDINQARKNLETSDVNIRFFRNQTLPQVNVEAQYSAAGLGGTQLIRGAGFPGPIIGQTQRGFGSVLEDVFARSFPDWTVGISIGYPIGRSTAEASLARARLERSQAETRIRGIELQIATQVRDLGRQVSTNQKRVEATRAARQLAERRLEAEQKKFAVGLSTSFQVFQAQRDLAQARNNELRSVLDYNKSLVDFEAVQEVSVGGGGVIVGGSGGGGTGASGVGGSAIGTGGGGTIGGSTQRFQ